MASTAAVLNILVNASTGKAQAELTALDRRLKGTAAQGAATSGVMGGKFNKGMAAAAGGAAAFAVAGAVAGKALFDLGKEFDEAYDTIRVGTGATGKQLDKLKRDFRSVASQVPDDFKTTGKAIADLNTRLDLTGKPLQRMAKDMLNLSRITETDLEGNIESVAKALQDWDVPVKRQTSALNGLYRLGQRSGASVADLSDNIQKFGSPLRTLGFEFGEAAAMFAQFQKTGVNMQTMVPGLKLAIGNLVGPTDELKATLEGLGVSASNPGKALKQILDLLGNKSSLSAIEKMNLAMDVFGKRAGADMAEAIKQGRFNVDSFWATFRNGKESIGKATRDTNDFGENMRILFNKLKVVLEPMGTAVFDAVTKLSLALSQLPIRKVVADVRRFFKTNQDLKDVLKATGVAFRVFGKVAAEVWRVMKDQLKGLVDFFRGNFMIIRGVIRVVSRAIRGDWKGAWDAVREIVKGAVVMVLGVMRAMTAPVRAIIGKVAGALKGTFRSAWGTVKSIFRDGANAVIGIVNTIIGVLNKIPGVDIGKVGIILDPNIGKDANGPSLGRQRGGTIYGGKPSGDSVPALLERGEYVLNRKAVQKVGVENLNRLNFKQAARFQTGGPIGMIGGGIADAVGNLASTAGGAVSGLAGKALGKGAGFFINQLPKPDLPSPFTALGPWLIEHVTDWIKWKVPKLGGSLGNVTGNLGQAMALAQQMGLGITSTTGGQHAPGSYHYQGRAFDASNGVNTPEMMAYAKAAAAKWGSRMLEMFYDPLGWFIDNGQKFPGAIGGHSDHVHVAMQRGGIVELMRGGPAEHKVVRNVGKFLLNRGFDFRATAGILGNAWREGLWNPAQMEFTGAHNGGLYGFTTSPVSLQDMKNFASRRGKRWDDEIVQTNFMLSHGNPPGIQLRGPMNALETIAQTTEHFMSNWEHPLASAAGLSERVAAGHDASNILRAAGIVRAGSEGDGKSEQQQRRDERASRKDARNKRVQDLIKKAFGAKSAQAKKGAFWQILDMYAKYGDFESRGSRYGGAGPGLSEAATFLSRAGQIASIANPNRGAGQLYNLVKWLQGNVDMTGTEKANDAMSDRLKKVREAGGGRAQKRRQKLHKRLAKYGTDFPWKEALNKNARTDEILDDLSNILSRDHQAEWSEFGSEYSPAELKKEQGVLHKLFATRDNRYRMLMRAIPWAEKAQKFYEGKVRSASSDPAQKWMLPGYRKGLNSVKGLLNGGTGNFSLREDLKTLVGASGVAGLSIYGGTRGDAFSRWQELLGTKSGGGAGVSSLDLSGLLQIVEFARYGGYDALPKFHSGGVIPGPRGQEVPIMAQAGETVVPNGGLGDVKVEVNFADGMGWLKDFVDVRVSENGRRSDQMMKAGVR